MVKVRAVDLHKQILAGGGEMGRLICEKDWSTTSVGAPDTWPQSLLTTVMIMLSSRAPMILCWGPDLICFYNNAYRILLGENKTHSSLIGMNAWNLWEEEWKTVKPLIDQILNGEEAAASENLIIPVFRNGKKEEAYWSRSYSPVKDESGNIAAVLLTCHETTEKVLYYQLLKEINRRYIDNIMQASVPMCLLRGENFVLEIVNLPMLEMLDKTLEELLNKQVYEALPEIQNQGLEAMLEQVYTTGEKYIANERSIRLLRKGKLETTYMNFTCEAFRNSDGKIDGLVVTVSEVTMQVIARKQIEESEKRFRNLADSAPVLIWMGGAERLCNYCNKTWLNFTGRTIGEESGNGWLEGVHADDLQKCLYTYVTAFDKREEFYMEFRLRRSDRKYRWISVHGVPRISLDGVFEGYIAAGMDIHDRVVYQEKLKEDEEKLSMVIEASDLGTWELDLKTMEASYSNQYLKIFGYQTRVNLTHAELIQHLHPDDLKIRENAFKEAYLTGVLHYEARLIWKDKSIHWVEGKGKIFYDNKKNPSYMVGTVRDITDEKLFQKRLQQREQKFRLLADSMPQNVWTGDPEGNLNYFNKSMYDYSGLSVQQLTSGGWLQLVHPDDLSENIRVWKQAIETGQDFLIEHRFRRHDGVYHWQLSRAVPQRDDQGNIQMWVGTSTDIQEQKEFTNELEKQVQERTGELKKKNTDLQKMNKELQSFAYISSHDLQEPLRKIQTFASRILAKEKQTLSEDGLTYFLGMQRAASRMQTLIQDLLAYSRSGNIEKNFVKTGVKEIVEEVKCDFTEMLLQKQGTIELEGNVELKAIPFQIIQLFHNLISNAIKFSSSEKPLRVVIRCTQEDGNRLNVPGIAPDKKYCHISISDNGIGFDPQYKDRIFEVFQRLHGKEEYSGTGIGLSIVKKIVDNHSGLITATGELNRGATFDIYLPV